jgi:hypothetical protein
VTASNDNRAAHDIHRTPIDDARSSPAANHDPIPRTDVRLARRRDMSQRTE